MSGIRDRSVVRSSVTASAKYCCSGSLLRLAKGSTTIDRRGAAAGCKIDGTTGAPAAAGVGADLVAGQSHQPTTAMTSAAAAAAAIAAMALRRRRGAALGTPDAGRS